MIALICIMDMGNIVLEYNYIDFSLVNIIYYLQ